MSAYEIHYVTVYDSAYVSSFPEAQYSLLLEFVSCELREVAFLGAFQHDSFFVVLRRVLLVYLRYQVTYFLREFHGSVLLMETLYVVYELGYVL